ncbi:MAG: FixH family protein [Azoarcus sp.]|jgi:hypothetical protein|nr:FixH family protein [Azoarcus sp.]
MNIQTDALDHEPWYRQMWPWLLMTPPALAVVFGIYFFVVSNQTFDGLVADDYYKEGMTIVKLVDKYKRAQDLGLSAHASVRAEAMSVTLSAAQEKDLPVSLHLTIVHPTRSGRDQEALLEKGQNGLYSGTFAPLTAGKWRFQIEDESRTWRMEGAANLPAETEVLIEPSGS